MSMTATPVTLGDVQNIQIGMATFTDATAAAMIANQIAAATTSLNTYANGLIASAFGVSSAANFAPVSISVDNLILGGVPPAGALGSATTTPPFLPNELQNLTIGFAPNQVNLATKLGLANPTIYVTEQMAQGLASVGDTNLAGSAFTTLYGISTTTAPTAAQIQTFAQTIQTQTGAAASTTVQEANFWISYYTTNGLPPGISNLAPWVAGLAAAAGDAIGAAIVGNSKGTGFSQQLVFNALVDNAEVLGGVKNADGSLVTYQVGKSLTAQQVPVPLQASAGPSSNPTIVDIIPRELSFETTQNSEPEIAVNPLNPMQMIVSAFGFSPPDYFSSTDGGTTWSLFGRLAHGDSTVAFSQDGSKVLATTLTSVDGNPDKGSVINTFSSTVATGNFGTTPIDTFSIGTKGLDQPWIETGPANQVYVAFNNTKSGIAGATASIRVSSDGGDNYGPPIILDREPALRDDPSVREAVNGNTVYAVFDRWTKNIGNTADGTRYDSQLVVVRSDNAGADGFKALGAGGNGVQVATPIVPFSDNGNTLLSIGQNRTDIGTAIAVDPSNSKHVVVAFSNVTAYDPATKVGVIQVVVDESTDSGTTWNQKFISPPNMARSGDSSVAILANGAIGLLYDSYDPTTNKLSQHLVTTTNDFKNVTDTTLATESNLTPVNQGQPYLGDYQTLVGQGNTFYGVFGASNADNGSNAAIQNVTFLRSFTGTPGTPDFQLTDAAGAPVAASIDPFFFKFTPPAAAPLVGVSQAPLDHAIV